MEAKRKLYLVLTLCIISSDFLLCYAQLFGHKKGHEGLEMLLAAGILAKILRKHKHHHHHHGHHHGHHHHGRSANVEPAASQPHPRQLPPPPLPPPPHHHPAYYHQYQQPPPLQYPNLAPQASAPIAFSYSVDPLNPSNSESHAVYAPFSIGFQAQPMQRAR